MTEVEVLVPAEIEAEFPGRIAEVDPRVHLCPVQRDGSVDNASAPRVLFRADLPTKAMRRVLEEYPSVEWIHSAAAGVEHLLPELEGYEGIVTNSAGVHGEPIAEWVIAMMFTHAKKLPLLLQHSREHEWKSDLGEELGGKTLGIVGAGGIGRAIARRVRGLDMEVIGTRSSGEPTEHIRDMYTPDRLHEMLGRSDYVVIATPLTAQTMGLIGDPELRAMKQSAVLLNIARGKVVQTDALLQALSEGQISGAYLDVTDPEPLPPDHPLWRAPNIVITAHTSGHSPRSSERVVSFFCENLRSWLNGEPLQNVVHRDREY